MMQRDIAGVQSDKIRAAKSSIRDDFLKEAVARISEIEPSTTGPDADVDSFEGVGWAHRLGAALKGKTASEQSAMLETAPRIVSGNVTNRSRALLLLIELYGFDPWHDLRWAKQRRAASLEEIVDFMGALRPEDLARVRKEYRAVLSALRRKSISWPKVMIVTAVGVGFGGLTGGLAAPLIGGAIGTSMGLTGAAATSAGLATLGGGSLAAGGLGMAGGTALLAGLGGAAGGGVAAGGAHLAGWTSGQVVADAVRLEVLTKLVILDADGDDAKARKVVEGLHQRISELQRTAMEIMDSIARLSEELSIAKARLKETEGELARSEAETARLKQELAEAKRQRKEVEKSQTALEVVAERLEDAV